MSHVTGLDSSDAELMTTSQQIRKVLINHSQSDARQSAPGLDQEDSKCPRLLSEGANEESSAGNISEVSKVECRNLNVVLHEWACICDVGCRI